MPVYAPQRLGEYSPDNAAIVIPTDNVSLQESIMAQIGEMHYQDMDIYTRYAVEAALCFGGQKTDVPHWEENTYVFQSKIEAQQRKIDAMEHEIEMLKQMIMSGIAEETVYVYQSKKVASSSIARSIRAAGMNGFHVHDFHFKARGFRDDFIGSMIKKTSGKVISIVREPVARQISLLWQYWGTGGEDFLKKYESLEDLEAKFFGIPNREDEFEWYRKEFLSVLDIDIYEYPFDRQLGYSVIEKDGISLLLLKMEKVDSLEGVIASFLGVEDFKLIRGNVSGEKSYRYAYRNYLENVKVPSGFLEYYYNGNPYMDYFYTVEEKREFRRKWEKTVQEKG